MANARVEVCDQGTFELYWRPIGAPADCTALNFHGACVECHAGMALLMDGTCLKPAEVLHLELDGEEMNIAPLAKFGDRPTFHSLSSVGRYLAQCTVGLRNSQSCTPLILHMSPLTLHTYPSYSAHVPLSFCICTPMQTDGYAADGPYGKPALDLKGTAYMNLPALTLGGQISICSYVRHQGPKFYASLYAMGNVDRAYTTNPDYGDILWMKFIRSTLELEVLTKRGSAWRYMRIPDGWYVSRVTRRDYSCYHAGRLLD